jgi:hypothetical protein
MMSAFHHKKIKPQNLHDWGSESAIDPINPLVYIQARNRHFLQALSDSRYCIPGIAGMGMHYTYYIPPQILLDSFAKKH